MLPMSVSALPFLQVKVNSLSLSEYILTACCLNVMSKFVRTIGLVFMLNLNPEDTSFGL